MGELDLEEMRSQARDHALGILADVWAAARQAGLPLGDPPHIEIRTTKALNRFDPVTYSILIPLWLEARPAIRSLYTRLAGSPAAAPGFFNNCFHWFYIPHHAAQAMQHALRLQLSRWDAESLCHDVAATYWRQVAGQSARLEEFAQQVQRALDRLEDPTPADRQPERFFDEHYGNLVQQPERYLYYQFRLALESIPRCRTLEFAKLLRGRFG